MRTSPFFLLKRLTLSLLVIGLLSSCLSDSLSPTHEEEPPPQEPITEPVPPDGILETVTWNVEWYGHTSRGPSDEALQTSNAVEVLDSLEADLYALQEVFDNDALQNIVSKMAEYRGFTSDYNTSPSFSQQTAFIYNTNTIDSLSSGLITEGQNSGDWAGGRFPMFFEFNYSFQNTTIPIYAVVIHAEAFADQESYDSRREAAQSLYNFLINNKADANIILLGDYNDDIDISTFENNETPYQPFVDDSQNFQIATAPLSQNNESSIIGFDEMIDHITLSNELFNLYVDGSEDVFMEVQDFITDYENTTTDHFPVVSRFDITQNQ